MPPRRGRSLGGAPESVSLERNEYETPTDRIRDLQPYDARRGEGYPTINAPIIDQQERVQSMESAIRWNKEDIPLHYADIGTGIQCLRNKGIINGKLPEDFFRYLSANLFTKILYNFYDYVNYSRRGIEEKYWVMIYQMADASSDESMNGKIDEFKNALEAYADHVSRTDAMLI